ncbi:MAG: 30S ribosomal protein S8 [Pseudomonadales bacterium]|nr:30S ribosomal protein S8 [Pseudomonadales bacterium]
MSMQDPISDMLTRLRNAQNARHTDVSMPCSVTKLAICKVLENEGYIDSFSSDGQSKPVLTIVLRYHNGGAVIQKIDRVSRPGLRIYKGCEDLPVVEGGLGVAIVSTCNGVVTGQAAKAAGVGGEVLCTVF